MVVAVKSESSPGTFIGHTQCDWPHTPPNKRTPALAVVGGGRDVLGAAAEAAEVASVDMI